MMDHRPPRELSHHVALQKHEDQMPPGEGKRYEGLYQVAL